MDTEMCVHCFGSLDDGKVSTEAKKGNRKLVFKAFELTNIELEAGYLCNLCYEIINTIEEFQMDFINRGREASEINDEENEPQST